MFGNKLIVTEVLDRALFQSYSVVTANLDFMW
jgi:hypothetical protein